MQRSSKDKWKDLFSLHSGERFSFHVVLVAVLLAAAWVAYEQWFHRSAAADLSNDRAVLDQWVAEREAADTLEKARSRTVELFAFDPNHLQLDRWQALGLSRRQAETIHRYEEKGGDFKSKAELARMRVIKPELLAQWWPYIQLPDSAAERPNRYAQQEHDWPANENKTWDATPKRTFDRAVRTVEINAADTLQLASLPGVGAATARSIVRFRDKLGGFLSLDQLQEVYLLKQHPENIDLFRPMLTLDPSNVRRIPINSCSPGELMGHPYASKNVAKALVSYRQMHGQFATMEGIKGCPLVTDSVFTKLAPYLRLE